MYENELKKWRIEELKNNKSDSDSSIRQFVSSSIPNYFSLLNIPPAFDLDLKTLESAYFKAQRQYHPDRFVGKPAAERQAALQRSVDINRAYECLKNPLTRAQYLLLLQKIIVGTEHDSIKPSHALLTEVMELREDLPEKSAIEKMIAESIAKIGDDFQKKAFDAMAQETIRLGYLEKIRQEIRP